MERHAPCPHCAELISEELVVGQFVDCPDCAFALDVAILQWRVVDSILDVQP